MKFEVPEIEFVHFDTKDIITTSADYGDTCAAGCTSWEDFSPFPLRESPRLKP